MNATPEHRRRLEFANARSAGAARVLLNMVGMMVGMNWFKPTAAAIATAALVSGCYTTATVPRAEIACLRGSLSAPQALGGAVRLGPRTEIRVRRTDGTVTSWFSAADVGIGVDGLVTGKTYPLASSKEVVIFGADEGAEELLSAIAPPDGEISTIAQRLRVRVQNPRSLLPWISAYATGAVGLHRRPGMFSFRGARGEWATARIPGTTLAVHAPAPLSHVEIAEGMPWREVAGLELQNLDPLSTAGAVVGLPIAGAIIAAATLGAAVAVADGDDPTPDIALAVDVGEIAGAAAESGGHDDGTTVDSDAVDGARGRPAVFVASAESESTAGATPLFSPEARRRDQFKLIVAGEAGVAGNGAPTGSVGAGLRLYDFVEITARLRSLEFDEAGISATAATAAATSTSLHLLGGVRLALHIDRDGDPLTSFVFGGEVLGGAMGDGSSLTEFGLVLGPRFGIGERMFASLLFSPSLISVGGFADRPHRTVGQILIGAEIGFDL